MSGELSARSIDLFIAASDIFVGGFNVEQFNNPFMRRANLLKVPLSSSLFFGSIPFENPVFPLLFLIYSAVLIINF